MICTNKQTKERLILSEEEAFNLDVRLWDTVHYINASPLLRIETSLCKLFNNYFGFDCINHPVYGLNDLRLYI